MKSFEVLDRAADLIEPEGAWTQYRLARDINGDTIDFNSDKAVCWCGEGAVTRIIGNYFTEEFSKIDDLFFRYFDITLCRWNDSPSRTQAEVVAKLREAAALARSEGE